MIAHVVGTVLEKTLPGSLVIDVNGIGYEVQVATGDFDIALLDSIGKYHTYHYIREQSQELFGFSNIAAKKLFELLITVQGVGPKAALAILSVGDFESVRSAIARGDSKFIQQANGVGKKTAERLVVDLSDKVGMPSKMSSDFIQMEIDTSDEAVEALIALGFTATDAIKSLSQVAKDLSTSERVREALKK